MTLSQLRAMVRDGVTVEQEGEWWIFDGCVFIRVDHGKQIRVPIWARK